MLIDYLVDWWWIFPMVGILGGGKAGLSPFSENFAKRRSGQEMQGFVDAPGSQEQGVLDSFQNLNNEQITAILEGLSRAKSPVMFQSLALDSNDQATLDRSYAGAHANLLRQAGILGQDLASTRGLNRSDTPVSEVVMREFLPAAAQLESEKAKYGLGLGLNMRQLGENARQFNLSSLFSGSQITPSSGLALMGNLERTRMARAGQKINSWNIPSPLDNMEQGSRIYSNVMSGNQGFIGAGKSDVRLKRDIRPVAWHWKDGETGEQLGVIAQEVERSHPHLVSRNADGHLMVEYGALVAMLLSERESLYARLATYEGAV